MLAFICFLSFSASVAFLTSFEDRVVGWGWSARFSGGDVGTGGGILGSFAGACLLALRVLVQFKFEFVGLMVGFIIGSTVVELAPLVCAATGLLVEPFPLFASCYAFLSSCPICFSISMASFLDGIRTRGASVFVDLESPSGMIGVGCDSGEEHVHLPAGRSLSRHLFCSTSFRASQALILLVAAPIQLISQLWSSALMLLGLRKWLYPEVLGSRK